MRGKISKGKKIRGDIPWALHGHIERMGKITTQFLTEKENSINNTEKRWGMEGGKVTRAACH